MITQTELMEALNYNSDTGCFTWKESGKGKKKGVTGTINAFGYVQIVICGVIHKAHRLAWLHVYGVWPDKNIDHLNHDRADNRIENLREATQAENRKNLRLSKDSISGVIGVNLVRKTGSWFARIKVNGRTIGLGTYKDKFEAICARLSANNKYNFHENHGR